MRYFAPVNAQEFKERILRTGTYETLRRGRRLPSWLATPIAHVRMGGIYLWGNLACRDDRASFETNLFAEFALKPVRMMESLGAVVHYDGFDRVRNTPFPVVWAANHMSPLETCALLPAVLAFSPTTIVLKESLAHYPVFGLVVRTIHTIRLRRKNAMEDLRATLEQGEQALREGRSVVVFPEGQRSLTFNPAAFNSIGVKLAQRAKVPLVPLALRTDAMQIGRLNKDLFTVHAERPVHFECGEPIPPDIPQREALERARSFIAERLAAWQTEFPTRTPLLPPPSA